MFSSKNVFCFITYKCLKCCNIFGPVLELFVCMFHFDDSMELLCNRVPTEYFCLVFIYTFMVWKRTDMDKKVGQSRREHLCNTRQRRWRKDGHASFGSHSFMSRTRSLTLILWIFRNHCCFSGYFYGHEEGGIQHHCIMLIMRWYPCYCRRSLLMLFSCGLRGKGMTMTVQGNPTPDLSEGKKER